MVNVGVNVQHQAVPCEDTKNVNMLYILLSDNFIFNTQIYKKSSIASHDYSVHYTSSGI